MNCTEVADTCNRLLKVGIIYDLKQGLMLRGRNSMNHRFLSQNRVCLRFLLSQHRSLSSLKLSSPPTMAEISSSSVQRQLCKVWSCSVSSIMVIRKNMEDLGIWQRFVSFSLLCYFRRGLSCFVINSGRRKKSGLKKPQMF